MNRLKELRVERDELQENIGKIIGVSGRAIGNYETGKRKMSPDKITKLAKYFNVSIEYFLGESDVRNPEELKNIQFANHGGLNTEGLGEEELKELQRQIDFIKKMKNKKEK
jgi:transcriptional regulator with XRE-family HTH domain